ncbi:hypothetical protein MBANPS3_011935 [Mucor bainieri]
MAKTLSRPSMIVDILNTEGSRLAGQFVDEVFSVVKMAQGVSVFADDPSRQLNEGHLMSLLHGDELYDISLRDLNTYNRFRKENPRLSSRDAAQAYRAYLADNPEQKKQELR